MSTILEENVIEESAVENEPAVKKLRKEVQYHYSTHISHLYFVDINERCMDLIIPL